MASNAHEFRYAINLLDNGTVVTHDGEYLGTWQIDDTDAIYEFRADGKSGRTCTDNNIPALCYRIEDWLVERDAG